MNQPCLKLTAYFGERQRAVGVGQRPGFLAVTVADRDGGSGLNWIGAIGAA